MASGIGGIWHSSESTQQELSNEYQHDRVEMVFKKSLCSCALDESSLSIGRVKAKEHLWVDSGLGIAVCFSYLLPV